MKNDFYNYNDKKINDQIMSAAKGQLQEIVDLINEKEYPLKNNHFGVETNEYYLSVHLEGFPTIYDLGFNATVVLYSNNKENKRVSFNFKENKVIGSIDNRETNRLKQLYLDETGKVANIAFEVMKKEVEKLKEYNNETNVKISI